MPEAMPDSEALVDTARSSAFRAYAVSFEGSSGVPSAGWQKTIESGAR